MTFEEFFKKKKINLALLNTAEPALFAEFQSHYQLMGEKSFDHTKKYWFNLLRRRYHLPDEPKVEKVIIENKIAEQTVTESIIEKVEAPAAKLGFKPKFKTGATTVAPAENVPVIPEEKPASDTVQKIPVANLGFKPKFKPAASHIENTPLPTEEKIEPGVNAESSAPKLGFKPKFKSTSAPIENAPVTTEEKIEQGKAEDSPPKLGFRPKFKSAAAKPAEEIVPEPETKQSETLNPVQESKSAYIPKFQTRNIKPKTGDDE